MTKLTKSRTLHRACVECPSVDHHISSCSTYITAERRKICKFPEKVSPRTIKAAGIFFACKRFPKVPLIIVVCRMFVKLNNLY